MAGPSMKIKKGDTVQVISGPDRGAKGKVIVEGVATAKRHRKARSATDTGGIVDKNMPIPVSNVAVVSPKDGKPTRVGFKFEDGKKVRICKRTGVEL